MLFQPLNPISQAYVSLSVTFELDEKAQIGSNNQLSHLSPMPPLAEMCIPASVILIAAAIYVGKWRSFWNDVVQHSAHPPELLEFSVNFNLKQFKRWAGRRALGQLSVARISLSDPSEDRHSRVGNLKDFSDSVTRSIRTNPEQLLHWLTREHAFKLKYCIGSASEDGKVFHFANAECLRHDHYFAFYPSYIGREEVRASTVNCFKLR